MMIKARPALRYRLAAACTMTTGGMSPVSALILGLGAVAALAAPQRPAKRASGSPLETIAYKESANGFDGAPRGWNSFGIQANGATAPGFRFDQAHVTAQCDRLASLGAGFDTCSLDSGWSVGGNGDEFGRITFDDTVFNIPQLADHLHANGLKLGVYVVPGAFISDADKTILGTNTTIGDVCHGNEGLARCVFDFAQPAAQTWHDSVAAQFDSWGIDLVKLDFVTPGSPDNGQMLPPDGSGTVIAWHKAIAQTGRQMRLDISWKLDRTQEFFNIWNDNADTMRTDQDINNSGASSFTAWPTVQRAIENYRQFIIVGRQFFGNLSVHPDMDNLYIGNDASVSGVTDAERQTIFTHWIGAGANLILGSDLTNLDSFGLGLLGNKDALAVADFNSKWPIQPRNPGTGGQDPRQLQAWIGGPSESGKVVVVLANYGPDLGQGGFDGTATGTQAVSATWEDLGIRGSFKVHDVWNNVDFGEQNTVVAAELGPGESVLLTLTPA